MSEEYVLHGDLFKDGNIKYPVFIHLGNAAHFTIMIGDSAFLDIRGFIWGISKHWHCNFSCITQITILKDGQYIKIYERRTSK